MLQEKRFRPVGAAREASSEFRFLAATNHDLAVMVGEGKFREDLYFRLRSLELVLPPLREREGDIPVIAKAVLERLCEHMGVPGKRLSEPFLGAIAFLRVAQAARDPEALGLRSRPQPHARPWAGPRGRKAEVRPAMLFGSEASKMFFREAPAHPICRTEEANRFDSSDKPWMRFRAAHPFPPGYWTR